MRIIPGLCYRFLLARNSQPFQAMLQRKIVPLPDGAFLIMIIKKCMGKKEEKYGEEKAA